MKNDIFNKIKPFTNKVGFAIKKHSPEILISLGVIGVITSTVMACVSTAKVKNVLETSKEDIQAIHEQSKEVNDREEKKALTAVYFRTAFKFVKLYIPSIILGTLSLTSIITSNRILRKRNVALAAAYATIDRGFKEYRANVIERFGKDVDKELKYCIKTKKVLEKTIDPETGKEIVKEKEIKIASAENHSPYSRFYDDGCKGWSRDVEYNLMFLKAQQHYANDLLQVNGYLFLNDVYDMLGIPRSKAGQVVGWLYNEDNKEGDNFVDFGLNEMEKEIDEDESDALDGYERAIILDFNVDGPILDKATLTK